MNDAINQSVFVCHGQADTELVKALVEYLSICSCIPLAFRCSYLPGCALNREDTQAGELKYEIMRADVVVAVVTQEALLDAQFVLELATAWVYDKWIVPVMEKGLSRDDLPHSLRELQTLSLDAADSLVELRKNVCFERIDSENSQQALDHLSKVVLEQHEEQKSEGESTLRTKAILAEATCGQPVPAPEPTRFAVGTAFEVDSSVRLLGRRFPSAIESLNAGMALSDCFFNQRKSKSSGFADKLDGSFGGFLDALGGSWNDIRVLEDLEVFRGVTENLISTLPPAKNDISFWYNLGSCVSTMLNLAVNRAPRSRRKREANAIQWRRSFERFRHLASELNLRQREIETICAMLENLIRPEGEKDPANLKRCLERVRRQAVVYDQA